MNLCNSEEKKRATEAAVERTTRALYAFLDGVTAH